LVIDAAVLMSVCSHW